MLMSLRCRCVDRLSVRPIEAWNPRTEPNADGNQPSSWVPDRLTAPSRQAHEQHQGAIRARRTDWLVRTFASLAVFFSAWHPDMPRCAAHEPVAEVLAQQANSKTATELYAAAAKSQDARRYDQAAASWRKFIKENPSEPLIPQVQYYLGVCCLHMQKLPDAEQALSAALAEIRADTASESAKGKPGANKPTTQDAADDRHDSWREDTFITLGWVHFLQGAENVPGQLEKTTDILGQYLADFPKGEWVDEALFYRGEAWIQQGEPRRAIDDHQRIVNEFAESPLRAAALFSLAVNRHDLGETDQAARNYDRFLSEFENHDLVSDVAFRRAQLHSEQGAYIKAAELFFRAAKSRSFAARDQALFQAGYCSSVADRFAEAADAYALVADQCPDSPLANQARLDAGRCLHLAKQHQAASKRLSQSLESDDPGLRLQARHWLCRVHLATEQFEAGAAESARGLDWIRKNANPDHPMRLPLRLDHAEALEAIPGKSAPALEIYLSIVDDYGNSPVAPRALYRAIRLTAILKDLETNRTLTERFIKNFPDHELIPDVREIHADIALAQGEPATAESQLNQLMAQPPQSPTERIARSPQSPAAPLPQPTPSSGGPETTTPANARQSAMPLPTGPQTPAEPTPAEPTPTEPTPTATSEPAGSTDAPESREELAIKLGQSLFLQNKHEACINALASITDVNQHTPGQAKAFYLMGTSQLKLGYNEDAFQSLSSALVCDPDSPHAPQICLRLAQSMKNLGRVPDAIKVLSRVVDLYPDSELREQSIVQIAELQYAAGNNEAALLRYKQLLGEHPESTWTDRAAFGVARVAIREGKEERAVTLLDRLLRKELEQQLGQEIRMLRASLLQRRGDHMQALKDIESVLLSKPTGDFRSDALLLAVPSHIQTNHPGLAHQCLQSILDENPTYPRTDQVVYQEAWLAKRSGDESGALRHFGRLVATLPNSPLAAEANYHLGEAALMSNQFREAQPYFASACQKSQNKELIEKSLHRLAWCHFHLDDFAGSQAVLDQQLEMFPAGRLAVVGRFLKAECLFMRSDYENALKEFERVADGDGLTAKQESLVYLHAGQAAGKLQKWQEAERWLAQIHMKFRQSDYAPVAYWEMAQVLREQDRNNEAETVIRRAAQADQSAVAARAQFELAKMAEDGGRMGAAYREYQVLMYGYGGKFAPPEVKRLQIKAALRAADCAVHKAKNAFQSDEEKYVRQSEKCLQFVIDHAPGTEHGRTAASRMANLIDTFDVQPINR